MRVMGYVWKEWEGGGGVEMGAGRTEGRKENIVN